MTDLEASGAYQVYQVTVIGNSDVDVDARIPWSCFPYFRSCPILILTPPTNHRTLLH